MAQRFLVHTLTPYLAKLGARRGDIIVDRLTEEPRYLITRRMPPAGEVTGHLLAAIADGNLRYLDEGAPEIITPRLLVVRGERQA
jgi:hypothetical protein